MKLTPKDILAGHPPPIVALCQKLRRLVSSAIPQAEERAYPGWHAIGYRHPQAGYLGGIFPFDEAVKFYFEHGARLPDPDHILEGTGKQVRYLSLTPGARVPTRSLRALLAAAVSRNWSDRRQ